MTRKRYDHPNEALQDQQAHAGVQLPDGVSVEDAAADLYSRVGARFPVRWEPWSPAEPVVDTAALPSGVSESDVETALTNMKTDGVL